MWTTKKTIAKQSEDFVVINVNEKKEKETEGNPVLTKREEKIISLDKRASGDYVTISDYENKKRGGLGRNQVLAVLSNKALYYAGLLTSSRLHRRCPQIIWFNKSPLTITTGAALQQLLLSTFVINVDPLGSIKNGIVVSGDTILFTQNGRYRVTLRFNLTAVQDTGLAAGDMIGCAVYDTLSVITGSDAIINKYTGLGGGAFASTTVLIDVQDITKAYSFWVNAIIAGVAANFACNCDVVVQSTDDVLN